MGGPTRTFLEDEKSNDDEVVPTPHHTACSFVQRGTTVHAERQGTKVVSQYTSISARVYDDDKTPPVVFASVSVSLLSLSNAGASTTLLSFFVIFLLDWMVHPLGPTSSSFCCRPCPVVDPWNGINLKK